MVKNLQTDDRPLSCSPSRFIACTTEIVLIIWGESTSSSTLFFEHKDAFKNICHSFKPERAILAETKTQTNVASHIYKASKCLTLVTNVRAG